MLTRYLESVSLESVFNFQFVIFGIFGQARKVSLLHFTFDLVETTPA